MCIPDQRLSSKAYLVILKYNTKHKFIVTANNTFVNKDNDYLFAFSSLVKIAHSFHEP